MDSLQVLAIEAGLCTVRTVIGSLNEDQPIVVGDDCVCDPLDCKVEVSRGIARSPSRRKRLILHIHSEDVPSIPIPSGQQLPPLDDLCLTVCRIKPIPIRRKPISLKRMHVQHHYDSFTPHVIDKLIHNLKGR